MPYRSSSEFPESEQYHQPQGNYIGYHLPSAIPILTAREIQDEVLLQQESFHNMGSLFQCIPDQVLSSGHLEQDLQNSAIAG